MSLNRPAPDTAFAFIKTGLNCTGIVGYEPTTIWNNFFWYCRDKKTPGEIWMAGYGGVYRPGLSLRWSIFLSWTVACLRIQKGLTSISLYYIGRWESYPLQHPTTPSSGKDDDLIKWLFVQFFDLRPPRNWGDKPLSIKSRFSPDWSRRRRPCFEYPLIRLERNINLSRNFRGKDRFLTWVFLSIADSLEPVSLIDDGVRFHFHQCMPIFFCLRCMYLWGYGICCKMAHVPIQPPLSCSCWPSIRSKATSQLWELFIIGHIFFPDNNISHKGPVQKVLPVTPYDLNQPAGRRAPSENSSLPR